MNQDVAANLGDLERRVFAVVCDHDEITVADVLSALQREGRSLAYTTVMTVLSRLWEKGYLLRRRDGKAYLYQARSHAAIAGELGGRLAREALFGYGEPAVSAFLTSLTPEQRAVLSRLLQSHPDETSLENASDGNASH